MHNNTVVLLAKGVDSMAKPAFFIKHVDELGRIVLPKPVREILELKPRDEVKIVLNGDSIVITKNKDSCIFCGNKNNLAQFGKDFICRSCIAKISDLR